MRKMPVVLLEPAVFVTVISPILCLIILALNAVYAWYLPSEDGQCSFKGLEVWYGQ